MSNERRPLFTECVDPSPKGESRRSLFDATPEPPKVVGSRSAPLFEAPTRDRAAPLFGDAKLRKRVDISIGDLKKYTQDDAVIKIAHQQILETNVDELCLSYVLNWGSDLQKEYSDILDKVLHYSTHSMINDIKVGISSMIQKISELDLEDVTKKSWFSSKEDRIEKMKQEMEKLRQSGNLLNSSALVLLHDEVIALKSVLDKITGKIEPYLVSCQFFAEYQKDDFPNHLYISRLQSLLTTKLGISNDKTTINSLASTIIDLVDAVNNVIRTEIPMWCSSFSSLIVGTLDIQTLKKSQDSILQKLKQTIQ